MRIERHRTDDGETRYSMVVTLPSTGSEAVLAELRIFGRTEGIDEVIYPNTEPLGAQRIIGPLARSESAGILRSWRDATDAHRQAAASGGECSDA